MIDKAEQMLDGSERRAIKYADMVELADTQVWGTWGENRAGSTPVIRTIQNIISLVANLGWLYTPI